MPGDPTKLPLGEAPRSARRCRQTKRPRHLQRQLPATRQDRRDAERLLFRSMRTRAGPGRAPCGLDLGDSLGINNKLYKLPQSISDLPEYNYEAVGFSDHRPFVGQLIARVIGSAE